MRSCVPTWKGLSCRRKEPRGAFPSCVALYKELAEDCNDRREIMQEWCTRMSEAIEATSRESEQADATWADVIKRPPHLPLISPERRYAAPFP